ncbi:hypothetical protein OG394_35295 [Kribbella sp. NBC_01245]|uniref:hypothetical protein n=1 Tax=Kribbella sp. NBC_01245 TaxID=2903578 RepID=UPI002E27C447|nr:hypothetical protein [Kribbella sp. NBC_01245]
MTPEIWAAELEREGKAVLPLRRRPFIFPLCILGLLCVAKTMDLISTIRSESAWGMGGSFDIAVLILVGSALLVMGWCVFRRVPAVTIDATGVRSGRRSVSWVDVHTVERQLGASATLVSDGKPIRIGKMHVAEPDALTAWLRSLVERKRIR